MTRCGHSQQTRINNQTLLHLVLGPYFAFEDRAAAI